MLNISQNTIKNKIPTEEFTSLNANHLARFHKIMVRWIVGVMLFGLAILFLPWTQNIQSEGQVTALSPEQRPQTVPANIDGRIEKWFVQEGQLVQKGDTIAYISEIKTEYADPNLVENTQSQITAKNSSIDSYIGKAGALDEQIVAMRQQLEFKTNQLRNKIENTKFKIISDSIALEQAKIDIDIALTQYKREQDLNEKGISSLQDVENKRLKYQSTITKLTEAENKLDISRNQLKIDRTDLNTIAAETNEKINKAESDRFSALSSRFQAEGEVNKLEIQVANYETRRSFWYIKAPQTGYVVQTEKSGIGETVKEGTALATIRPLDAKLAVELYIRPMDLPLVNPGQEVRFIFDGWPAFIFSGWPSQSFGTYSGKIFAVDRVISDNGKYRILVEADSEEKPWPEAIQIGSGAQGIALLNNVPLWYEIWRRLNGFPPDFYEQEVAKLPKMKEPIRSVK